MDFELHSEATTMRVYHSVFVRRDIGEPIFRSLGIDEVPGDQDFIWFDVKEGDPKWALVAEAIRQYRETRKPLFGTGARPLVEDRVWTKFSETDRSRAEFLEMVPLSHHGYPQPEKDLGYLRETYDLSNACKQCWAGSRQKASFRMTGEPKWGKHSILQLNWEFEEYFVSSLAYEQVFEKHGVPFRTVLSHSDGRVLSNVVQLVVDDTVSVETKDLSSSQCPVCGVRSFSVCGRGARPAPVATVLPMFKSEQYFDSYRRRVFVSRLLYGAIKAMNLKGADFLPCASPLLSPGLDRGVRPNATP